ncbi:MAG: PAS domain S-box protein [bacterium]|nr:PAS domain S-box protein [bacterium]
MENIVYFHHSPVPMWVFDNETLKILDVNDAAVRKYGWTREEFLQLTIRDIRPPEDIPKLDQDLKQLEEGLSDTTIWRHLTQKGDTIYVEVTAHSIEYQDRKARLVMIHDVTHLLKLQERLKRVNRNLRLLSSVNQIIIRTQTEQELFQKITLLLTQEGSYVIAWIVLPKQNCPEELEIVAQAGITSEQELLKKLLNPNLPNNPLYRVFQEKVPIFIPNLNRTLFLGEVSSEQYSTKPICLVSLPLIGGTEVLGVLNLFTCEFYPYDEDEKYLLMELAHDVGFSLSTLRKQREAERVLLERNRIFELSEIPMCIADFRGYFKQINNAWKRMLGWKIEEFLERPWIDFVHPSDHQKTIDVFQQLREGQEINNFVNRYLTVDGDYRYLKWSAFAFPKEGLIYGVCIDITEQMRLEDELKNSEEQYRMLVELSHDSVFLLHENRLIFVNTRFLELFGLTRLEIESLEFDFYELIAEPFRQTFQQYAEQLLSNPSLQKQQFEMKVHTKKKIDRYVEVSLTYVPYREDNVLLGIFHDITDRKSYEEELRQIAKVDAIGRLAGGVAHDFNNVLTVIGGTTDIINMLLEPDHPAHNELMTIKTMVERASSLTRQLLAFVRKQPHLPKVVSLKEVVLNMQKVLRRLIGENIEFQVVCEENTPYVNIDPSMLEQVIMNLVVNARDALKKNGRIMIRTSLLQYWDIDTQMPPEIPIGDYGVLSVEDNGSGMSKEVMERIFEPFFTTKPEGKGTGLGLATVKSIIHEAGGYISVQSAINEGTTFKIFLPLAIEIESEQMKKVELKGSSEVQKTIAIAEDEEFIRNLLFKSLTNLGCRVKLFHNGEQLLQWLDTLKPEDYPHFILSDIVMPVMGGLELYREVKKRFSQIPILLMSGYTSDMDYEKLKHENVYLINKPFTISELIQKIQQIVSQNNKEVPT